MSCCTSDNLIMLFLLLPQEKCHQYWPAERSARYQYFVVDPMAEYNMPQYILREFKVTDARVSLWTLHVESLCVVLKTTPPTRSISAVWGWRCKTCLIDLRCVTLSLPCVFTHTCVFGCIDSQSSKLLL